MSTQATLHQILTSEPRILKQLTLVVSDNDQVIFLGDGCYQLSRWSLPNAAFVMQDDLTVRGLSYRDVNIISPETWVTMTLNSTNVMTWK